mmetsp:Transcript_11264/g.16782  ORF Transcript_11264/g.16782 Transcript_11264/m.16782 type:complete len:156 (-) Transcript_11264:142-609(-)
MTNIATRVHLLILSLIICKCSSSPLRDACEQLSFTPGSLDGKCFRSLAIEEGEEVQNLVPDSYIEVCFEGDSVKAFAGCNYMSSKCVVDGDLSLSCEYMMSTEMWCQDLMSQENFLSTFLTSNPVLATDGYSLCMTSGDTVIGLLDKDEIDEERK